MSLTEDYRAIRQRLRNPPGGKQSSELEIVAGHLHGREDFERTRRNRELNRAARQIRAYQLCEEFKAKLSEWVRGSDEEEPDFPEIPKVSVKSIIGTVCEHFNLSQKEVFSKRRQANLVLARHTAMFLAKELTGLSYPQIGYYIGGVDHTSAIHGCQRIQARIIADASVADHVAAIKTKLGVA